MPTVNKSLAILALLAFFLPFITISCNGNAMVQMSGAKLAQCSVSTCSPEDFLSPQLKAMAGSNNGALKTNIPGTNWGGKDNPFNDANYVLFAAIAGLIAAITVFLGRPGEILSGVASVGVIALLFIFKSKFGDAVTPHLTSPDMAAASALIKIELQFSIGFWASLILSAASAILAFKGTSPQGVVLAGAGGSTGSVGGLPQQPPSSSSTSRQNLSAACPSCGAAVTPGNQFCLSCGTPLAVIAPPSPPTEAPSAPKPQGNSCPACGADATPGNQFCLSCGTPLAVIAPPSPPTEAPSAPKPQGNSCPACGADATPGNKFCLSCGTALAAPVASVEPHEAASPAPQAATKAAAAAASPVAQPLLFTAPAAPEPPPAAPAEETSAPARSVAAPAISELPAEAPTPFEEPVGAPAAPVEQTPPAAQPQTQQACTACGAALAPEQKFCLACGTPVGQSVRPAEARTPPASETVAVTPPASAVPFQEGPFPTPPRSGSKALVIGVILIAVFGAAGWFAWQYFARPDVTVTAIPQRIHVAAGGRTSLQANVSGSKDTDVKWSIQEGDKGGQITPQGDMVEGNQSRATAMYTAPQTPGTFHVLATSHANPSRTARVEIVVGGGMQGETVQPIPEKPAAIPPSAPAAAAASPMAAQIIGTWRGPAADMNTTIGGDSTIAMTSDADPQKNLRGTYHFTDNSHIQIDFGGGDVRTWEIVGVDDKYLRVTSQTSTGASAMIFTKLS